MTTERDPRSRLDDTQVRIVAHRLQATGGAASRTSDAPPRNESGGAQKNTGSAINAQTRGGEQLPQIVLVDRDVDALREVAVALRDQYDFHVTISGNEALTLLQSGEIDAIIVGQTLYSSTGLNVLAEARRRAPHTQRVLLANAVESTGIDRDAAPAQPFRILTRPCTPQKLLELLEAMDEAVDEAPEQTPAPPIKAPPASQPRVQGAKNSAPASREPQAPPSRIATTKSVAPVISYSNQYQGDYEHVVLETPTPRRARATVPSGRILAENLPIVVYTDNGEFYHAVCGALQDQHDIRLATQLARAVEMAEMGACPILMTDRAGTQAELQRISIAIRAAEPALVTIASGSPTEGLALRKLLNTPALHSFLPKPLSVPLVRLTIESAKRHYIQSKTPVQLFDEAEPEPKREAPVARAPLPQVQAYRPMQTFEQNFDIEDRFDIRRLAPYGAVALVVLLLLAAGGWYWQHLNHENAQVAVLMEAELELAQRAYDAGDYVTPDNANALYFYRRVLKRDEAQSAALQGIDNIVDRLVEQTERQLTEDKIDAASDSLALLQELRPNHKRLAFLEGQLNKANRYRQSQKLSEQSAEMARVEAAKATAAQLRLAESRNIDAQNVGQTAGLISNASQRSQAISRWLATAHQRIAQGKLVAPENDSAEYYFRLAERADPNSAVVDQGLREIGGRLVTEAQEALTRQQIDLARRRLADAARFAPDTGTVAKIQSDIEAAANANVRGNFLRLALQRTRENSLFEPTQDSAKYYLSQLQRLDAAGAETQQATRAIALKLIDNANQATAQRQLNIAVRLLDEVRRLGFNAVELKDADNRLQTARNPPPSTTPSDGAVEAPKIIRQVAPQFPEDAMQANISGWVDVAFKINGAGDVYDAVAIASSPRGPFAAKFERSAVAAIGQYKFERRDIRESQTQSMVVRVQFKAK